MIAHKAEEEGVIAAEVIAGHNVHMHYKSIPGVVYTWPEIASVGLTEKQVMESGREYRTGKFPFSANGRARSMGESSGFVKFVADAKTDELLGAHMIGPNVSELISEVVLAFEYRGSSEDIAVTVRASTLSESHEGSSSGDSAARCTSKACPAIDLDLTAPPEDAGHAHPAHGDARRHAVSTARSVLSWPSRQRHRRTSRSRDRATARCGARALRRHRRHGNGAAPPRCSRGRARRGCGHAAHERGRRHAQAGAGYASTGRSAIGNILTLLRHQGFRKARV